MTTPIRVLHVVGRMDRGGVETWLMHVFRRIDRSRLVFDFLVHTDRPASYDQEIRALGGRLLPLPVPTPGFRYGARLKTALHGQQQYDVIHSHVHHFSGVVLRAAAKAGIPVRIAHSHSDTSAVEANATLARRMYLRLTEALINQHATVALAASEKAGRALFSPSRFARARWQLLHYGIDLQPFDGTTDVSTVRAELGLTRDQFVIGHVGNFHPVKNHRFLIDVFEAYAQQNPRAALLMIGEGPQRAEIHRIVLARGLANRVVFAGQRSDVPRLLMGAIDLMVFPSLWEGLPIAVVEAQAAGVPIVLSDRVSDEVDLVPRLIQRLDVERCADEWVAACSRLDGVRNHELGYRSVTNSDLNISRNIESLHRIYETAVERIRSPHVRAA